MRERARHRPRSRLMSQPGRLLSLPVLLSPPLTDSRPLIFLGSFPGQASTGLYHSCLSARHSAKLWVERRASPPICPLHVPSGTHSENTPPHAHPGRCSQIHRLCCSPTHTQFRFPCGITCFALLSKEGGQELSGNVPPTTTTPVPGSFLLHLGNLGAFGGRPCSVGFTDTLTHS